jgi:hypothetical protein
MATSVHFLRVTLDTTPAAAGITEASVTLTAEDFYSPQNRCQEQLSASKKIEKQFSGRRAPRRRRTRRELAEQLRAEAMH